MERKRPWAIPPYTPGNKIKSYNTGHRDLGRTHLTQALC